MRTEFPPERLAEPGMAEAERVIRSCVHCGFCTATCPTYALLGDERDSPRGRIYLIKTMLEAGGPPAPEVVRHVDRCLSCLSCVTTCPSSVDYGRLIDEARGYIEANHRRSLADRWLRALLAVVMTRPRLFGTLLRIGRPFAGLGRALPAGRLRALAELAKTAPRDAAPPIPVVTPAEGVPVARALLLTGCVQDAVGGRIHHATVRLLARMGVETHAPAPSRCCGALPLHLGKREAARAHARRLLDQWAPILDKVDAIVVDASGCGSVLKDYGHLLGDDPAYAARAGKVVTLVADVTEFVARLKLPEPVNPPGGSVAYHAACSLQHGQRVRAEPEALLRAAGFEVRRIAEGHLCCGSAGTYNILQPEIAAALRDRKAANVDATGADVLAIGNLGCMVQLACAVAMPVVHTVELLDWATGGPRPAALDG